MKIAKGISRILIGTLFIFSGIVKAIDPLGSAYKFHDYFHAFSLGFLDKLSLPLAILLCTAEFTGGLSVLTGIKQRTGIWLVFLLMLFFTPLTFILALTNPVSDCGCFGDAIKLTNWQTFVKNIILLPAVLTLFAGRKDVKTMYKPAIEWAIISGMAIVFVLFSISNLIFLPAIDFLPYKTGVKIADKMTIPEGAAPDVYKTTFIYEKNGMKKEFSLSDYPANDTSWKFVQQNSTIVKKGYQPPIHDFRISSNDGEDITRNILSDSGYTLLMISKKLAETSGRKLMDGFELGRACVSGGIDFYIITSSGSDELKKYENGLKFCSADETTLKTMMRANPGFILLRNGTIVGKWSWANVPKKNWFLEIVSKRN